MKFRSKTAAVALAVMFALGAIGAASASAIPPEFRHAQSKAFDGHGPGGEIEGPEGLYSFERSNLTGELSGVGGGSENESTSTLSNVTLAFTEAAVYAGICYTKVNGEKVNAGERVGEVVLGGLKGRLGYIDKAERTVGVMFEPVTEPDATCTANNKKYQYLGDIMAHIRPVGEYTKHFTLTFSREGDKQSPTWFEGEKETFPMAPETLPLTIGANWQCKGETCSFENVQYEQGIQTTVEIETETATEIVATPLPRVETEAASGLGATQATLKGSVDPEGAETKYYFEYGTSTKYGSHTAEASAGEGSTSEKVSTAVTGLTPDTTYHYRIVASNHGGTSYGADMQFVSRPADVSFKPAKGSGAFPVAFASSGGKTTFYTPAGKVECQHETGAGKFTSAQEAGVTIKFTGCVLGSVACGKVGESKLGEIETTALKGVLAYAFQAKSEEREAGLVLSPASGETFTTFACGALVTLTVKGSVIGVVSPLNSLTKAFGVVFKESSGSVQEPSEYEAEGGTKVKAAQTCSVNGGAAKACVEESDPSLTLTGEEALIEA